MKKNRRDFLKVTGIAGLSLAGGGVLKSYATESMNRDGTNLAQAIKDYEKEHIQHFNMSGYAAPGMDNYWCWAKRPYLYQYHGAHGRS